MTDQKSEAFKALAELVGTDDPGLTRLEKAGNRHEVVEKVCALVGARHALRADVIRTGPRPFRTYRHVVMARSHAAEVLHEAGFNYAEIGRALCTTRSTARWLVMRWQDHKAGLRGMVSEDQAHAVRDLIKAGMTVNGACHQVGVGVTKFQSREVVMRMEGKL